MEHAAIAEVLRFWFGELLPRQWFVKEARLDEEVRRRFGRLHERMIREPIDVWLASPESALAAVIVLDQFPRNMFRDTPQAFASDGMALEISRRAIAAGHDKRLDQKQRQFLYMPFMHAENGDDQARALELFTALGDKEALDFAVKHKAIVDRFGRFPHRNAILGRPSTAEEEAFLKEPGSSF